MKGVPETVELIDCEIEAVGVAARALIGTRRENTKETTIRAALREIFVKLNFSDMAIEPMGDFYGLKTINNLRRGEL